MASSDSNIMSEDPIQAYQEAMRNLETNTMQVERLIGEINRGAEALQDWKHVAIADGKTGFPIEAQQNSINPDNWPSAQQLAEILSGWHQNRQVANNAWNAIPRERRVYLHSPPEV